MAKKTKKIEKVQRHKKFDLSIDRPEQAAEIIDALTALQQDKGWHLLKQIFEGNIAVLEGSILKKVDPDSGAPLSEEECDRLRDRLSYLVELLEKPQAIIRQFSQTSPQEPDYDPYHKIPIRRPNG